MVVNDGQNQRSRVFKVEVPAADFPAGAVVAAVLLDAASRRWQRGGMGV